MIPLYSTEIFVFTPAGELKSLSKGSTALDFAFSVHTGLGLKTRGVKVNGKMVPLSHILNSGDQIEIIKSENTKPSSNWLDYVKTSRAKAKIRTALKEEKKLLKNDKLQHSYPHSWRSKAPLIYRATPQWFISMEKNSLRSKAIKAINETTFYPPKGKERLLSMIAVSYTHLRAHET